MPVKVVVYVNKDGVPFSTTTSYATSATKEAAAPADESKPQEHAPEAYQNKEVEQPSQAQEAAPDSYDSGTQQASNQEQSSQPAPSATQPDQYAPEQPSQSAQASETAQPTDSQAGQSSGSGSGSGITYTPYNDDDSCKSGDQVMSDFQKISGYSFVRIYGTDCNQLDTVIPAAKSRGMKVFAGIDERNITSDDTLQQEVEYLARAAGGSWDIYDTISVCNECVHRGSKDAGTVAGAVNKVRDMLSAKGYGGPVVTVETAGALRDHPNLCEASSYAACNAHAFFNGGVAAKDAGKFVVDQAKLVAEACGGKKVVVTETGWPSQGSPNNAAVPSPENQQAALGSIKDAFSSNPAGVIYFSAFDEGWKDDRADTFGCEKFWGVLH